MHLKPIYRRMLLPVMMLSLTGCAGFELRKGPSPVLDGTAAYNASGNKNVLIRALAADAAVDIDGPGQPDYYLVAEAGFNYVDDQCRAYFDELFFLNKGREQVKSGLAATGQTTLAILGITGAAVPTMTIVAQAFGLASAATDIVAGTYLYALPPATTQGFVERLQLAFRDAASHNSTSVRSPADAYYLVQRYLNLCLPPTIEAEITKQISNTSAVGQQVGNGEFFSLTTFSTAPVPQPRFIGPSPNAGSSSPNASFRQVSENRPTVIPRTAKERIEDRTGLEPQSSEGLPFAITVSEKRMKADVLGRFQRNVLCVPETVKFDQTTRDGIKIFQKTVQPKLVATGEIGDLERQNLNSYDRTGHVCPADAQNFYELSTYFDENYNLIPDQVEELQNMLNNRDQGGQITVSKSLDSATRDKIAAVRQAMGDLGDPSSAQRQVTPAFRNALRKRVK